MATVAQIVDALEQRYRPQWAEPWDAVGLSVGDPSATVSTVAWALDATQATVEQALAAGGELLVTHHPLFLDAVHSVATSSARGRVVQQLIANGCALFTAHTNADRANPGVSDALALALGVEPVEPLEVLQGAAVGIGLGRIGRIAPMSGQQFIDHVAAVLGVGPAGVRAAGSTDRTVTTVAVCGGAGASAIDAAARAGVDAYVTADISHHRAIDALEQYGSAAPLLIDAGHFATERPWLTMAADLLVSDLASQGTTVEQVVLSAITDPWSAQATRRGQE